MIEDLKTFEVDTDLNLTNAGKSTLISARLSS